ncbi:unnamed protein product [Microthlaspi erraticum]|uniref:Retrotransposon gag domain-containing protein n=1 Tax=Microthlaspi erraticum TaxID=1685480 RepID=A0A6D2IFA7_9BRAS|nr:unnamed protein product [Microthlaspi erraticum]
MIMGGLLDDDSISAIKEYERKAITAQRYPYIHKGIPTISFTDKDASELDIPHLDPLVVTLQIHDCDVAKVLVDTGSTMNLIFLETSDRMGVEERSIKPTSRPLTGFTAEHVYSCGTVRLPVYVGGISKLLKFIVMDKPAIYNAILGTPWLHEMKAVISTFDQCVKFPMPSGIFTLRGDQRMTRSCFLRERKLRTASSFMVIEPPNQQPREESRPTSDDETNRSDVTRRIATTQEAIPPILQQRNAEPTWKSDLRSNMSTKKPKKLSNLFEMEQLEDEPLRSYLDRFKSMLLDLDEIPGAPRISEPVLIQALGNGLRHQSRFREDFRLRPFSTLKDAFLRAENYVRIEQDIPQLRFDPKDPRIHSSPCRDDAHVSDDETRRSIENRALSDRHASPQCSFSDQEILEIIADIRRTPLTSRLSEIPLKKRTSLHLNFYDGRDDPKQWISSFMTTMRIPKYAFDDLAAAFLKQHLRFALDDLILCKSNDDRVDRLGKFGFSWEGPYRVARVVKPGIYQLEDNLGNTSERLWSSTELRKFHD